MPFLAPSLVQLRSEINQRWPDRDKKSDGWLGDTAHAARVSDHNPDDNGMVHAIDVDKDGIDVDVVLSETIGDPRVNYVIHNRVIYSRIRDFKPKHYTGTNPHTGHIHISILYTDRAENSQAQWITTKPAETPTSSEEFDDMKDFTVSATAARHLGGDVKEGDTVSPEKALFWSFIRATESVHEIEDIAERLDSLENKMDMILTAIAKEK
jgi:hypothetical protein